MKIVKDSVERVAALARLSFSEAEKEKLQVDLSNILTMCEKLNEVDTSNEEPLIFLTEEINVFREDVPIPPVTKEQALKNAPQKDSDYFKMPKVIDRE